MGLLKDFLVIDANRRSAQNALRVEAMNRRDRILQLTSEAQQKRDAIGELEQELAGHFQMKHEAQVTVALDDGHFPAPPHVQNALPREDGEPSARGPSQ